MSREDVRTAYHALEKVAKANPDKVALVFEKKEVSFAALLGDVDAAAARLAAGGVGYGDAFAVYSQNHPAFVHFYYAAAKLGAVFVPINPNMTATEAAYATRDSAAKLLLHDDVGAPIAGHALPRDMCRPIGGFLAQSASPSDSVQADPHDDFLIIYTSGSTGSPKAVVLDHAAQLAAAASLREMWSLSEDDVTLVALPLGYLYGLSTAAAVSLQAGQRIVILRRFHPGDVLEALVEHRATVFHGVPTMFAMMLEYAEQRDLKVDLSPMRALVCAGSPLAAELKARFERRFGKAVWDYYAMTECTPVFGVHASDSSNVPNGSVGKLAPGAAAKLLDAGNKESATGAHAELLVRGPSMIKRYHKDPALTASALLDGWFRTGDLGYRDARGYYYISGRIKDVIIRGGANIAPSEVEAVIGRHPSVQDVAVIGVPDRVFGEVPVAFVVKRHGTQVSEKEIEAFAAIELADFKVPRQIVFLPELPLGKTGKVDKGSLKRNWPKPVSG